MKKIYLFVIGAAMMLAFGLSSCSNKDEEALNDLIGTYTNNGEASSNGAPSLARGSMNVLHIQSDNGETETCRVFHPYCGRVGWPVTVCESDDNTRSIYPMVFTAVIRNSSLFNVLQFEFSCDSVMSVTDLQVGDTINSLTSDGISLKAWQMESVEEPVKIQNKPSAPFGQILVVDKNSGDDGKPHITLELQDLVLQGWASCQLEGFYTFNGKIDFEISEGGIYPDDGFSIEPMLMPRVDLLLFMMDALHSSETQGRLTFFNEASEQQECLIINSEEEFQKAYKGHKELPGGMVNFDYCTLVIGHTYGEHGGITLGDYNLTDNGDTYQLDMTLNNNVNPDYAYTSAFTDLYFWKIYPKMEKKPVIFNRIIQDVNLDPLGKESAYSYLRNRYTLELYSDPNGTIHRVGDGWEGDERFSLEFQADGIAVGRINDTNEFSFNYMLPYVSQRENYNDGTEHGIINLWNWQVTDVEDDNPASKQFMRFPNVTQLVFYQNYYVCFYISDKEWFHFRNNHVLDEYEYE
jgi:hypothetical protein